MPSLTILFESGINVVCLKTEKPLGNQLRRWLASEVLPSIDRTGGYRADAGTPRGARAGGRTPSQIEAQRLEKAARFLLKAERRAEAQRLYLEAAHVLAPEHVAASLVAAATPARSRRCWGSWPR